MKGFSYRTTVNKQNNTTTSQPNMSTQPTCKVCFQTGHLYRECTHPCIDAIHHQAINVWVAAATDPRRVGTLNTACFLAELPPYLMRAVLFRHCHPDLRDTNITPTGPANQWQWSVLANVRIWREREQYGYPLHSLPTRIGVYSSAARFDLEEMMRINYMKYRDEMMAHDPSLVSRNTVLNNTHTIASMLARVRRDLVSSHNTFTRDGLVEYTNELIGYLRAMNERTIANSVEPVSPNALPELSPMLLSVSADDYQQYRHRPTIANMVREQLPAPPIIPVSTLNAPPVPPPRSAVFSIDLAQKPPEEISSLTHSACTICWDELTPETGCSTDCNHAYCHTCMLSSIARVRSKTASSSGHRARYMYLKCAMCRTPVSTIANYSESDEVTQQILEMRMRLYTPL